MSTRWFGTQRESEHANPRLGERQLGLALSAVRGVLRTSLATVGAHIERGRPRGRVAIEDLMTLPLSRVRDRMQKATWPAFDHALQTGIVAVMIAAAALLVTHQAPVRAGHAHRPPHVTAAGAIGSNLRSHTAIVEAVSIPQPRPVPMASAAVPLKASPGTYFGEASR
jgi:hypothetical protein